MTLRRITGAAAALTIGLLGAPALASPAQAEDTESFTKAGPVDLSGSEPDGHVNIGELVTVGMVILSPGEWTVTAAATLTVEHPDNKHVGFCTLYVRDGRPDAQSDPPNPNQVGRAAGNGGSSSIWEAPDADGHRHAQLELEQFPDFTTPIVLTTTEDETVVDLVCAVNDNRPAEYGIYATDIAIEATRTPAPSPTASASPSPTPTATEPAAAGKGGSDSDASLPVTGASVPLFMAAGAGLLGLGGGLAGLAWRSKRRQRAALLDGLTE